MTTTEHAIRQPTAPLKCWCVRCEVRKLSLSHLPQTRAEAWLDRHTTRPQHHDRRLRHQFIDLFGFAVLNRAAVEAIRPYGPLVEAGAGTGYWSRELQEAGIDIIATDPNPQELWPGSFTWTQVHRLTGVQAVRHHPDRNLLLCWPSMDRWPSGIIERFQGDHLIYVGEPRSGCTGNNPMFDVLENRYRLVSHHRIPQFLDIRDALYVYQRKAPLQIDRLPRTPA